MKKVLFSLIILVFTTVSFAQNKKGTLLPQQVVKMCVPDTATVVEQQFIVELNGFRYTVKVQEFVYSPGRSNMFFLKTPAVEGNHFVEVRNIGVSTVAYPLESFRFPTGIKNISVLPSDDLKKLVFTYEYAGEKKRIEFQ